MVLPQQQHRIDFNEAIREMEKSNILIIHKNGKKQQQLAALATSKKDMNQPILFVKFLYCHILHEKTTATEQSNCPSHHNIPLAGRL